MILLDRVSSLQSICNFGSLNETAAFQLKLEPSETGIGFKMLIKSGFLMVDDLDLKLKLSFESC